MLIPSSLHLYPVWYCALLQAHYLALIKPEQMATVFKQSLTAAVLIDIATTALEVISRPPETATAGAGGAAGGSAGPVEQNCVVAAAGEGDGQGNGAEGGSNSSSRVETKGEDGGPKASRLSPGAAVELLGALCGVPRFDMALMCCTSKQKKQLQEEWEVAEQKGRSSLPLGLQGRLAALRPKFKV